jgi:hypothetical protein
MAVDLGTSLYDDGDLSPRMQVVSGVEALVLALVRRLQRTSGTLWYDRTVGRNLSDFLHQATRGSYEIEAAAETECGQDERVQTVEATATAASASGATRFEMNISGTSSEGPFDFVVGVSGVTVELLKYEAS